MYTKGLISRNKNVEKVSLDMLWMKKESSLTHNVTKQIIFVSPSTFLNWENLTGLCRYLTKALKPHCDKRTHHQMILVHLVTRENDILSCIGIDQREAIWGSVDHYVFTLCTHSHRYWSGPAQSLLMLGTKAFVSDTWAYRVFEANR